MRSLAVLFQPQPSTESNLDSHYTAHPQSEFRPYLKIRLYLSFVIKAKMSHAWVKPSLPESLSPLAASERNELCQQRDWDLGGC